MIYALLFLSWCACAGLGAYVAGEKGRGAAEGLILGFLFGPLGVLVVALLPAVAETPKPRRKRVPTRDPYAERREQRASADEDQALGYLDSIGPPQPPPGPVKLPAWLEGAAGDEPER